MRIRDGFEAIFRLGALTGALLSLGPLTVSGCGQSVLVGLDDALQGGEGGTATGGASASGGALSLSGAGTGDAPATGEAGAGACVPTACRGKYYECGDCIDNDRDGEVDGADTACLGPCDDDELGLSTGLKMSGGAPCRQDCYFDGDSGQGNDMCRSSQACDPLSVGPDYPPSGEMRCAYGSNESEADCQALATQPTACLDSCLPLVPNGCDCFGCCELPGRSGEFRFIGSGRGELGCRLDTLDDATTCPVCTPVKGCFNPCDSCEVCVGSAPDPSCNAPAACERGSACGTKAACPAGEYCVTGCCARVPR